MSRIFEALTEASKQRSTADTELQSHHNLPAPATAEYLFLRERILRLTPDLNQRTLLFASPSSDKGSLDIVTNFCLTLSEAGNKVLLVGINMDESFMRQKFGVSRVPEITEVLSGRRSIGEFTHKTIYRNLSLLSGDMLLTNPLSPEESRMLQTAIDDMKSVTDWIIFGCPPAHLINSSTGLVQIVDGTALIVEADKTGRGAARRAREHLEKGGANILGAILSNPKNYVPRWINRWL